MTSAVEVDADWRSWPAEQKQALLTRLADQIYQQRRASWTPYPWQVPPSEVPAHGLWLMLGGRGTGKTDGAARYMDDHVNGPPCDKRVPGGHRMSIVAPTLGDAAESCVLGPSGLRAHNPGVRLIHGQGGSKVRWPSGAEARLFGAYTPEDVERLRAGGNRCLIWLEEVAAMRYLGPALEHTAYGLRVGPRPHYVGSTTPKPRPEVRRLLADPGTITTRGRTAEAVHLATAVRDRLYAKYAGTRAGRQELDGELLEDVEGALWQWGALDRDRVTHHPPLVRVVVAVDPAATNTERSDETGIVVVGKDAAGDGYVLDDLSGKFDPSGWAAAAVSAYDRWGADALIAERNNGGDMVGETIKSVSPTTPFRLVNASRGKRTRAEPISVLYGAGRIHHVGNFPTLEGQMTTWVPDDPQSPDRMDALVWGLTDLMLGRAGGAVTAT